VTNNDLKVLLRELLAFPNETEWLKFKLNNAQELGEYSSAFSNSTYIHEKEYSYMG
jgi:ATP-dependent DNA helicase RecG